MGQVKVGTCSICGGPVVIESPWYGTRPPPEYCANCGAERAGHGPVIPMRPKSTGYYWQIRVSGGTKPDGDK